MLPEQLRVQLACSCCSCFLFHQFLPVSCSAGCTQQSVRQLFSSLRHQRSLPSRWMSSIFCRLSPLVPQTLSTTRMLLGCCYRRRQRRRSKARTKRRAGGARAAQPTAIVVLVAAVAVVLVSAAQPEKQQRRRRRRQAERRPKREAQCQQPFCLSLYVQNSLW